MTDGQLAEDGKPLDFADDEGTQWVMCTGAYKDILILAIRTRSRRGGAGVLAQQIVGQQGTAGGHGTMAGGQVPLRSRDAAELVAQLGQLALRMLEVDPQTEAESIIS